MKNLTKILFITIAFSFTFLFSFQEEEMPKREPAVTATPGTIKGEDDEIFTDTEGGKIYRFISRIETADMQRMSADTTRVPTREIDDSGNPVTKSRNGKPDNVDILPSLNAIWRINDKTNFRASVSQALARSNMREISHFVSVGKPEDSQIVGNNELERTLITNYDLMYEVYLKPGELFAVSVYYKNFIPPIVLKNLPQVSTPEIEPINTAAVNV